MFQKIIFNKTDYLKAFFKIFIIILFSFTTLIVLFILTSIAVSKINFSYKSLLPVTAVILSVNSTFNGFVTSRLFKENGLIWGILAGIITLAIVIIISIYYGIFSFTPILFIKILKFVCNNCITK